MTSTLPTTRAAHRIAWLAALAITIHVAEGALPSPLPGVKPGLANVVTVIAPVQYGTAYWLFFPHAARLHLLPVLMSTAVIFGAVSGLIAAYAVQRMRQDREAATPRTARLPPATASACRSICRSP